MDKPFLEVTNRALLSLPHSVRDELVPRLTPVRLSLRDTVYVPDRPVDAAYFIQSGMISSVIALDDGTESEVGIIGFDGVLGAQLYWRSTTTFATYVVQMTGTALRMDGREFRSCMAEMEPLRTAVLQAEEARQAQTMQTAACNARHRLERRLARWLLMMHDLARSDAIAMTQDFLAVMLSVHRPSLTRAAGALQDAGIIRHRGGRIMILDRTALEASACECYRAVRNRFAL